MQVKLKLSVQEKLNILTYTRQRFMYTDISEKELALELGITPRELRIIYSKYLGETPKVYITRIKMSKAKTLLRITDMSIIDIALMLGYENPSHMSAKFKEVYKVTPSSFRRMYFLSNEKTA